MDTQGLEPTCLRDGELASAHIVPDVFQLSSSADVVFLVVPKPAAEERLRMPHLYLAIPAALVLERRLRLPFT